MARSIIMLIIEDDRELYVRIATTIKGMFGHDCALIIQTQEKQPERDDLSCIGHVSRLRLLQALDESFQCPNPSSFDVILRSVCSVGQFSISQSYRVPPKKFADVRKIPMPAQCKGARKKLRH